MDKRIILTLMLSMFLFSFALANLESSDIKEIKVDLCYDSKFEFKECDTKDLTQTKIEENTKLLVKADAVYLINDRKELTKLEDKKTSSIYIHKKTADETYHVDNLNDIPVETYLEFYYTKQPNVITHINKYGDKVRTFNSWEYEWTPKTCTGGEEQTCSVDGYARIFTTLTENSVGSETFPLTFTPAQWVTDNQGYASFDGVDGKVTTTLTDNSIFNGTNGFTIISWINPINGGENNEGRIIDKTSDITSAEGFFFRITYTSNNARLITRINSGTTVTSSSNAFLLNSWSLITATILQNGTVSYTVNGVSVGGGTLNTTTQITTSKPLTIGNRAEATDRAFNGSIDDVLIYNRALSQDEITQLYNHNRSKGVCDLITENLTACYDFDDNSYGDKSGNGNYGTPEGGVSLVPEVNDVHQLKNTDYSLSKAGIFNINNNNYNFKLLHLNYDYYEYTTTTTGVRNGIADNVLLMVSNFFALVPTIGTILGVILLILVLTLLLMNVIKIKPNPDKDFTG